MKEKYFWVPKDTFEFSQKIKESLKGEILTNERIENLLFEVIFFLKPLIKKNNSLLVK